MWQRISQIHYINAAQFPLPITLCIDNRLLASFPVKRLVSARIWRDQATFGGIYREPVKYIAELWHNLVSPCFVRRLGTAQGS